MTTLPTFAGTPSERTLAEQIHEVMRMQGQFFASDAPIQQRVSHLVAFFAPRRGADEASTNAEINAAIAANPEIFVQTNDGDDIIITTGRAGIYHARAIDSKHSLQARLYEPEHPLPLDDLSVVMTTTRPTMPKIDPIYVSDYWLSAAPTSEDGSAPHENGERAITSADAVSTPDMPVAPVKKPLHMRRDATRVTLPQGITVDVALPLTQIMGLHGEAIISALRSSIEKDPIKRFAVFGSHVADEHAVNSFSKNEIRQITEYIENEQQVPVLDSDILVNVLRVNPRAADYERQRFALNYRLLKDLEFVGVAGANMWATRKLLDKIGANKRIKAADMAAFVNHLEEGFDDSLTVTPAATIQQRGTVEHKLTFFEWEYGILPFNDALAAILPSPVINRQGNAVLTFEMAQHNHYAVSVNVRFPAGTRGGWIQGFDELFREWFVPGAVITISRTNQPNLLTIGYQEVEDRVEQLLYIDDSKKKSKYAFTEMRVTSTVDEDLLPTQSNVGRIRKIKFFEISERKNIHTLLENIFMGFGEEVGSKQDPIYRLSFEQLFAVMSVYRTVTRKYLLHVLDEHEQCKRVNNTNGMWDCRVDVVVSERNDNAGGFYDEEEE
ncbi:MAG: hypothetical protein NT020_05195 [Chloroflexales bacterium]|nr:hypothetical protein [Chloroflexales bacterium]